MKLLRVALAIASFFALGVVGTAPAAAAPVWNLDIHHNETHFPPGETGQYWFDVNNVGDTGTSGPITLTVDLPAGLSLESIGEDQDFLGIQSWSCGGTVTVACTTSESLARHTVARRLYFTVAVAPGASGELTATATVEGGGAAVPATASEPTPIDPEPAGFGIVTDSFRPDFVAANGLTPVRESGAHPDLFTVPFDFNTITPDPSVPIQKIESEDIRNIHADLPPGFLGNPTAVGECTAAQLGAAACPASSQVGRIDLVTYPISPDPSVTFFNITTSVFNLSHPRGAVADLGFVFAGHPVHIKASLDPAHGYAITSSVPDINETLPPFHQKLTLWGVPADHSHDSERCPGFLNGFTSQECSTDAERKPFLTVPSECGKEHAMRLHHYDSWQNSGVFGPDIVYTQPGETTNCDKPRFDPEVAIHPTGQQASTPTGLDVHIKVPQTENPDALATPPVKRTVVTLPEGMSFSPSFADGLQACSLAQIKLGTNDPIECPDASRIGEVTLHTPLLPKQVEGSMYLAAQGDNPFDSLFALYLVVHDTEERGVLIKIPGRVDLDQRTGQITTTFDETPQFPFDDLTLKFRSGPRAPLVNPPACGTQTIGVKVTSWAQPDDPVDASNTYQVTEGPNGTPCPLDPAHRPFGPRMNAGTLNPSAGAYSPFLFRLSREDQEQELSRVTTVLPRGLLAKIAGIASCPEAAIASIPTVEGTGQSEAAAPACPASSLLGNISAGLGAGPGPNYFPGKVYLAGPYKGAPLSLAIVTPGLAGPFDLGSVVVRAALRVDRSTAQVTAVSDPFPTILHGVLLRVRDVRLRVDRPETTLNPTSCSPMSVAASITGVGGDLLSTADDSLAGVSSPFQVGNCASLGFKPKLSFRLFGGTRRGAHPKLKAVLKARPGDANIARASVALPSSEFLDQGHIKTVCTRVQFSAGQCPPGSIYGNAVAKTPLFGTPLEGPVYLRSSDHSLPDLVAALKGPASQPVEVDLVGRIDSVKGGIRNRFEIVPDAPVSTFSLQLQGGKRGLLVNSTNICRKANRATAKFTAHSGRVVVLRPALKGSCASKAKRAHPRAGNKQREP
jgi:hypothetical protein